MEIYEQLQKHFKDVELSQVAIAEELGVTKAYVNALLSGRQRFGKKQAQIWSEKFGLSKSWLLTGEGEMLRSNSLSEAGNAELVGHVFRASTPDEGVVNVRFFQISPSATFQEFCEGQNDEADLLPIIPPAGELVDESSCVFEVYGESMQPTIPNHAKVLCRELNASRWHTLSDGIAVIAYADKFVIKRIVKNRLGSDNYIILGSDNPDFPEEVVVQRADIRCMFQARHVISYPIK